ncbi:hypothetical protein D3C74_196070 [compost metagenome]
MISALVLALGLQVGEYNVQQVDVQDHYGKYSAAQGVDVPGQLNFEDQYILNGKKPEVGDKVYGIFSDNWKEDEYLVINAGKAPSGWRIGQ